jgi:hypothetical protein
MGNKIRLSASSLACYKACPCRYYYQYVLGLRPIEDTESQRMGTCWHALHEVYDQNPDDPMGAVVEHLNKMYSEPPISKTLFDWEVERITLLYSFVGYKWLYNDEGYEVESNEQKFELPLRSPATNNALQGIVVGKIDKIFSAGNNRFVHEYKSTSKSIDPDSTYWSHLTLDTQTRLYTYAARELGLGMCGVLYDVWHKPTIRPKKLTQADSKKFVETGEYCGEEFDVRWDDLGMTGKQLVPLVNMKPVVIEYGKKEGTFAIRETPEMFGARLLQDITERPEFYFVRREIVHHQADIEAFQYELVNIYQSIRSMAKNERWWRNEHQCQATFKCSYIDFCYNHLDIGPDDCPDNFKKLGE